MGSVAAQLFSGLSRNVRSGSWWASYMVSYWVAKTDKHHTIVEDLILPAATRICLGQFWGGKAPKNYTDNASIKQHCFTMHQWHGRRCFETITASHISQWILCVTAGWVNRRSGPGTAPGICSLRLWGSIKEDILFCKPLETRTTRQDIFKVLDIKWTSVVNMFVSVLMEKKPWRGDIMEW
jgi:hypothetical protein